MNVDFTRVGLDWDDVSARMSEAGIKVNAPFGEWWRLVTHRDVDDADVDRLVTALK